jgi:hypothetical protein
MPDLRTALTSALQQAANEWAADDEPHQQIQEKQMQQTQQTQQTPQEEPKTVTEVTFNMVRDNPGITRMEAMKRLAALGCKESSTSSLIAQFMAVDMMYKVNKGLFTRGDSHKGMTSTKVKKARKQKMTAARRIVKTLTLGEKLRDKIDKAIDQNKTVTALSNSGTLTVTPYEKTVGTAITGVTSIGAVGAVGSSHENVLLTMPYGKPVVKSAHQILSELNIIQAREVYDELKKIFGG